MTPITKKKEKSALEEKSLEKELDDEESQQGQEEMQTLSDCTDS